MRIGELASKAGLNVQTVRFYERRGLLREPARTLSGYRNYGQADLETVHFIRWCQRLGFTLKEVRQLLELHQAIARFPFTKAGQRRRELRSIIRIAGEKLANVQERIRLLQGMGNQLSSTIRKLQAEPQPVCPASEPPRRAPKRNSSSSRRARKSA